jgi:hypothetical protein
MFAIIRASTVAAISKYPPADSSFKNCLIKSMVFSDLLINIINYDPVPAWLTSRFEEKLNTNYNSSLWFSMKSW